MYERIDQENSVESFFFQFLFFYENYKGKHRGIKVFSKQCKGVNLGMPIYP